VEARGVDGHSFAAFRVLSEEITQVQFPHSLKMVG
jgi:hypothetical protein